MWFFGRILRSCIAMCGKLFTNPFPFPKYIPYDKRNKMAMMLRQLPSFRLVNSVNVEKQFGASGKATLTSTATNLLRWMQPSCTKSASN
jgi:hypothetical protein